MPELYNYVTEETCEVNDNWREFIPQYPSAQNLYDEHISMGRTPEEALYIVMKVIQNADTDDSLTDNQFWAPVYNKDGDKFITAYIDHTFKDKDEAYKTGFGFGIMEGIILGFRFTGEIIKVDLKNFSHFDAKIGRLEVYIFAGPNYDRLDAEFMERRKAGG